MINTVYNQNPLLWHILYRIKNEIENMTNNNKTLIKIDRSVTFDNPAHTHMEGKYNIYLAGKLPGAG